MNLRPIEDCISDTTDRVVGMMCDTSFHARLGLDSDLSYRLTGVRVAHIREDVARSYGALHDLPTLTTEEHIKGIALRLSAMTGADFDECLITTNEVFDPNHRVDHGPLCDDEATLALDPAQLQRDLGPLF